MMKEFPYYDNTIKGKIIRAWHILIAQIMIYKLIIEITINPGIIHDKPEMYRREYWTTTPKKDLIAKGFTKCVGLHDNIAWVGIRQYIKINNGEVFDVEIKDKHGNFIYSQDTPATLNDAMTSDADKEFFKGMGKAHTLRNMDMQTMIMIAIVAIGAGVGIYFLW